MATHADAPRALGGGFSARGRSFQTAAETAHASCQNSRSFLAVPCYRMRGIGRPMPQNKQLTGIQEQGRNRASPDVSIR